MRCRHFANGLPAIKKSNLPFSYVLPLTIQLEREMNNLAEQSHRPPFNLQVIGKNYFKKYCSQNTYINLYLPLNQAKMLPDFPSSWPQRSLLVKSCFFFLTLIDLLKSICLSFIHPLSKHSALCVTGSPQVWIESLYPWGHPVRHSPGHTLDTFCATCFVFGLTSDSRLSVTPAVPEDKGLVQCVQVLKRWTVSRTRDR